MKICHIAPFGPHRCGLYEAARDMAKADALAGHEIIFIDAGIVENGKKLASQINAVDDRAGFLLQTGSKELINSADLIIKHTGVVSDWIVQTQAPIIWIIHGRPLACFRPELNKKGIFYTLYNQLAQWPRTKKFVHFWPEFNDHWGLRIPDHKLHAVPFPVIDEQQYTPLGDKFPLEETGKYNILICDSEREDVDLYEMVIGCIKAVKTYPGLKFHFFGLNHPIPNCWQSVLGRLKDFGGLGMVRGRLAEMPSIYRSMDCLISPNRILTRTVAEALSCGLPVICQNGKHLKADIFCDMADPDDVVAAIGLFIDAKDKNAISQAEILERASDFKMETYSKHMNPLYEEVLK